MSSSKEWTDRLARWSRPASATEEQKASRAADMIREAVHRHAPFQRRKIEVYATGSYRNNTNVRSESDIDVAVVCHDSFFHELPPGVSADSMGWTSAAYGFAAFREDLHAALEAVFGADLQVGDKTFGVPENTYRLEADATPFFEFRH